MKANKGIPARHLRGIFKALPNINQKQLIIVQKTAPQKTYKVLKKLSGFISQSVIKDLEKETGTLMQMAATLSGDRDSHILVEE